MKLSKLMSDGILPNGEKPRLPGASREVTVHEQMYRYAEDLQQMLERQQTLEENCASLRDACSRLAESRDVLDSLIGHSADLHVVTDLAGVILQCNPASSVIAPMRDLLGSNLRNWVQGSYRDNFDALRESALHSTDTAAQWELRLRSSAEVGPGLIVSAHALAVQREGEVRNLYWVLRDVTRFREVEFESQISTMVFNTATEAVMITDLEGEILAVNPAFSRITGYSAEEAVGRMPRMLRSGLHDEGFYREFWKSLKDAGTWQGEIFNRRKSGEIYPGWLTVNAAHDSDGRVLSYVAVFSDLTRILQTERRLAYLAHHDMLTGLPNRLMFQDRLEHTLTQARRSGQPFTLIFIDLDRFKQINDSLGHEMGDIVLKEAAARLSSSVREADTVARLGGDEFVIIAPGLAGEAQIGLVATKLIDSLCLPIDIGDQQLFIGGSLGCASYPAHGDSDSLLLRHADAAMYRAKAAGGNTYMIHDPGKSPDTPSGRMESEFRQALERNELRLEYQPQIDARNGAVRGVEALLRWHHPLLGEVAPADFIPAADRSGMILPVGAWVLNTACKQLAEWGRRGISIRFVSVNLSSRQLRDPGLIGLVHAALEESGLVPERLELEISEAQALHQGAQDIARLVELRSIGVRIALDDYGSGYSSLAQLLQMPIDTVKLDQTFVAALGREEGARGGALTSAIVAVGQALGTTLVAEGVETTDQLSLLTQQGCQAIQGFLAARPMAPALFEDWYLENLSQGAED